MKRPCECLQKSPSTQSVLLLTERALQQKEFVRSVPVRAQLQPSHLGIHRLGIHRLGSQRLASRR